MQAVPPLRIAKWTLVDFAVAGHTAPPTPNNRPDKKSVNSTALKFSIQNHKVISIPLPCNYGASTSSSYIAQRTGSPVQSEFVCIPAPEATKHTR